MQYQRPTYPEATGRAPRFLVERLVEKYGAENMVWPVILGNRQGDNATIAYIYERNYQNQINSAQDTRPTSNRGVPNVFLDYLSRERQLPQDAPQELTALFGSAFNRSYDYIQEQGETLFTVDIDLMWNREEEWRALEFTTYHNQFTTLQRAESLISTMYRRPSWRTGEGAVALHRIVEAAEDLNADLRMVAVNTTQGINESYRTDGNAYWFPLSHSQIERLANGQVPENGRFGTVARFLDAL